MKGKAKRIPHLSFLLLFKFKTQEDLQEFTKSDDFAIYKQKLENLAYNCKGTLESGKN